VGWTVDLVSRLKKHNSGQVGSTKARKPLVLLYYEACRSKEKAIEREKYFITGFGRRFLSSRF
jgi:putative endonuclease